MPMLTDQQDAYGHLPQLAVRGLDSHEWAWCAAASWTSAPAAGTGRHCLHLREQGDEVRATDNSPLAVGTCRERGVRHAQVVPIAQLSSRLGVCDTVPQAVAAMNPALSLSRLRPDLAPEEMLTGWSAQAGSPEPEARVRGGEPS